MIPRGFIKFGDYVTVAYIDGSTYKVVTTKSSGASDYSATSSYETPIINLGDSSQTKELKGITIMHEPLVSGTTVTVSYKKDADTSYTTYLTSSTVNSLSRSVATALQFGEITFKITVTGGNTAITGLQFDCEEIEINAPY